MNELDALASDLKQLSSSSQTPSLSPSIEDLLAYLKDELDEDAIHGLHERLSTDPALASYLLDLSDPDRLNPDETMDVPSWQEVRARWKENTDTPNEPQKPPQAANSSFLYWAAAMTLVVAIGLMGHRVFLSPASAGPSTDLVHHVLSPDRQLRSGEATTLSSQLAQQHVFILTFAARNAFEEFEVVLEDADQHRIFVQKAKPTPEGTFDLLLPASHMGPGSYSIKIEGIDNNQREVLATYPFEWR